MHHSRSGKKMAWSSYTKPQSDGHSAFGSVQASAFRDSWPTLSARSPSHCAHSGVSVSHIYCTVSRWPSAWHTSCLCCLSALIPTLGLPGQRPRSSSLAAHPPPPPAPLPSQISGFSVWHKVAAQKMRSERRKANAASCKCPKVTSR